MKLQKSIKQHCWSSLYNIPAQPVSSVCLPLVGNTTVLAIYSKHQHIFDYTPRVHHTYTIHIQICVHMKGESYISSYIVGEIIT